MTKTHCKLKFYEQSNSNTIISDIHVKNFVSPVKPLLKIDKKIDVLLAEHKQNFKYLILLKFSSLSDQ